MSSITNEVQPYLMEENGSPYRAFYLLSQFISHKIIIIVDHDKKAIGILTPEDFQLKYLGKNGVFFLENKTVGDICNRKFQKITNSGDLYSQARSIFADTRVNDVPVLDETGVPVGIISRWMAFYKSFLADGRIPGKKGYAVAIMHAADVAQRKGYKEISVLEFGVAGGTGLVLAQKYAEQTARLTGIRIQVYGFDSGAGLPALKNGDSLTGWIEGDYPMDIDLLLPQLKSARLVLGEIEETTKTFFKDYSPAPIGAVFVDTDIYSSAVSILNFMRQGDAHFLPIVQMWFDDVFEGEDEFHGENLAIKEFNNSSEYIKIAPESLTNVKLRQCHRYNHPKYASQRSQIGVLGLRL